MAYVALAAVLSSAQACNYLYISFLSVWLWDLLLSLAEEVQLLLNCKMSFSQVTYIVARISSVMFITASTVTPLTDEHLSETIGQHHIPQAWTVISSAFTVSIAANSLLMFFRVRAVFYHSTPTVVAFALLWMATVGAALTVPFALQGGIITVQAGSSVIQIPEATVQRFAVSSYAMTAVYDALVVVAITYQLFFSRLRATPASEATGVSPKPVISYLKSLIRGEGLGKMSKTLLQTGLLYYFATVGMNTVALISVISPFVPVVNSMFAPPSVAITNIMTCRVYRQVKLGVLLQYPADVDTTTTQLLSSMRSRAWGILKLGDRSTSGEDGYDHGIELSEFTTRTHSIA